MTIIPGNAARDLFPPPQHRAATTAALCDVVRRDPHTLGVPRSRWTLATLGAHCAGLRPTSVSGLSRLLRRCRLRLKRGRGWIHSPDPAYAEKRQAIAAVIAAALGDPGIVVVYLDEVTVYRQPTLSLAYAPAGTDAPHARRSTRADTPTRLVGSLDHATAQVCMQRAATTSIAVLVQFYQDLVAAYPQARRIYVIQDNWPVHHHPDVLVALERQESRFTLPLPPSWATEPHAAALARWGSLRLPIQLVWLPTYASWLNPIEKLWRKLRQDVTQLHPWADDLQRLRTALDAFFVPFATGSPTLKRYVGLAISS
jgi:transposase